MRKRDSDLLIQDMLSAIRQIESYIARQDHDSFLHDRKTIDAVVRNLEVLVRSITALAARIRYSTAARAMAVACRTPQSNSPRINSSAAGHDGRTCSQDLACRR